MRLLCAPCLILGRGMTAPGGYLCGRRQVAAAGGPGDARGGALRVRIPDHGAGRRQAAGHILGVAQGAQHPPRRHRRAGELPPLAHPAPSSTTLAPLTTPARALLKLSQGAAGGWRTPLA
eukprot:9499115-Pyramimonas_sp.AAC.2